jgi:RNA polymerase sigma-70 factor (ECF subfamily)
MDERNWLRLSRADASSIQNLGGWLTTVVARVCLDMPRSRKSRGEESLGARVTEPVAADEGIGPESEALLADSIGPALLVVLETPAPAERVAFVLHDMFAVPFDEVASIVGRSPVAARGPGVDLTRQRKVVAAFLAASREGNFEALLAVLPCGPRAGGRVSCSTSRS